MTMQHNDWDDISPNCLERAKARHAKHTNISYRTADLGAKGVRLPKADFVLSVNALLMPSLAHRTRALDAVTRTVRKGGHLLLVTPALESVLLTEQRLIEWNLRSGLGPRAATRTELQAQGKHLHQGIVPINGMPTKHFLREELVATLESRGVDIEEIRKIEYRWDNEFDHPPGWMKKPLPWDWLVLARRS
jgi:ubiquinone/menaquinone biosynthesis C-methylase UbiE